jgi:hypothetical protein
MIEREYAYSRIDPKFGFVGVKLMYQQDSRNSRYPPPNSSRGRNPTIPAFNNTLSDHYNVPASAEDRRRHKELTDRNTRTASYEKYNKMKVGELRALLGKEKSKGLKKNDLVIALLD